MTTFNVTNNNDNGTGSLRQALSDARSNPGADTIEFNDALSGQTITLTSGSLDIFDDTTINGLGAENLTIDANNNSRVFYVRDNATISGLTITGGNAFGSPGNGGFINLRGGGIAVRGSSDNIEFILQDSVVTGNTAEDSGGGIAVSDAASASIINSSVTGNSAELGGGVYAYRGGEANIISSTISGNSADSGGGAAGIYDTTINITNSTVSGNSADSGGGISHGYGLSITNSTVTNNSANSASGVEGLGVNLTSSIISGNQNNDDIQSLYIYSNGNNLIGNGDNINNGTVGSDIVGTSNNPIDAGLGTLQNNGGSTRTHALLSESAAIDSGSNPNNLSTDQRGGNFNRTIGNSTDIGAYEVQSSSNPEPPVNGDINGTDGNDRITGTNADDVINGLGGNDRITGRAGNDTIDGGDGDDQILGNNGNNLIVGGRGKDTLIGARNGNDTLNGGDNNDRIRGLGGNDIINGDSGNDRLIGGGGRDILRGGQGNDILVGGGAQDTFVLAAGEGKDLIRDFSLGNDTIGLANGIAFDSLTFSGRNILLGSETLVTINGIDTSDLTEADFVFI